MYFIHAYCDYKVTMLIKNIFQFWFLTAITNVLLLRTPFPLIEEYYLFSRCTPFIYINAHFDKIVGEKIIFIREQAWISHAETCFSIVYLCYRPIRSSNTTTEKINFKCYIGTKGPCILLMYTGLYSPFFTCKRVRIVWNSPRQSCE